jgi:hypothetical protein
VESKKDRRRHRRLPLKLAVVCQKVGLSSGRVYRGNTVDVSPGGVLAEFNNCRLKNGELLSVDMSVPPTKGLLEYGGRLSSYARVVRVEGPRSPRTAKSGSMTQAVALEFCESPKLSV